MNQEAELIKIRDYCEYFEIKNYKVNSDMSVDIDGDVKMGNTDRYFLPFKFGKVTGGFGCSHNYLTSLEGCPNYVGGDFWCNNNKITTLQHLPINFYIGGNFWCDDNHIDNPTEFGRLFFGTIVGEIYTDHRIMDKFLNKNKNPPKKDLPRLLSELRKLVI